MRVVRYVKFQVVFSRFPNGSGDMGVMRLVSGGTGALGLVVGKWMIQRGARKVVLLSRSGTVSVGQPKLERALQQRQAHSSAQAIVRRCDVGDAAAVRDMVAELEGSYLSPIKGVVHAAGVLRGIDGIWMAPTCHRGSLHRERANPYMATKYSNRTRMGGALAMYGRWRRVPTGSCSLRTLLQDRPS